MFDILGSDIVVMQELKIQRKDLRDDMVLLDDWDCYFSLPKHKKGYSGVGIYTRSTTCSPSKAEEGLLGVLASPSGLPYRELPPDESIGGYPSTLQIADLGVDPEKLDAEGRCVVLEFPAFVLFGVYSPANSNGLRDDFRYGFICALDCRIRNLIREGKRVVLVGDLNVSRNEQDTASGAEDIQKARMTREDYVSSPNRRIFNQLLIGGEVFGRRDDGREQGVLWDTTRGFHPERKGMYTHWEQKINARPGNFGGRIDYVLVSEVMQSWIRDANIQEGLLGSDHCPVYADFKDVVDVNGIETPLSELMNPDSTTEKFPRMSTTGARLAPQFSAKRLPEFDKRRSIKSMFSSPTSKPSERSRTNIASPEKQTQTSHGLLTTINENLPSPQNQNSVGHLLSEFEASNTELSKRKAPVSTLKPVSKRAKPDPRPAAAKGQQSLRLFLQPKTKSHVGSILEQPQSSHHNASFPEASKHALEISGLSSTTEIAPGDQAAPNGSLLDNYRTSSQFDSGGLIQQPGESSTPSPTQVSLQLAEAEHNQRSWSALFSRPPAPLCEGHGEPCQTMQTKKKGSNQGRHFWMCARPLGPSGNKERGTQWRCSTFIWCSDRCNKPDQ